MSDVRRISLIALASVTTLGIVALAQQGAGDGLAATLAAQSSVAAQSSAEAPIVPFKIAVPDAELSDLKQRLARTRFPNEIEGSGWEAGANVAYMKELVAYWRDTYDWRKQEQLINRFDHFMTKIDGLNIHFIHQRSKYPNAKPLILLHGWLGPAFYEYIKVIDLLTDPVAHGGRPEDAFHVVIPDVPGYGFSDHPTERGWGADRTARAFVTLMARLGYNTKYAVSGGDIGAGIGNSMAINDGAHVMGRHSSCGGGCNLIQLPDDLVFAEDKPSTYLPGVNPGLSFEGVPLAEAEKTKARCAAFKDDWAHMGILSTKAQTVGFGLNDSPLGYLAFGMEQWQRYSDNDGNPEKHYTKDETLNWVMLYYLPGTGASAQRYIHEQEYGEAPAAAPPQRAQVPTGLACTPHEVTYGPRQLMERYFGSSLRVTDLPRGGHFMAWDEPELTAADLRDFFRTLK